MRVSVFHHRLQHKGRHQNRRRLYMDAFFYGNASIKPHLLQINVVLQSVQLLLQRDLLTLGAQVVPEQTAQMHDHLVGGGSILQPRHTGDHVQGVEQKMRIYLTFKHLQPGVFQILFQRKVPHLFPVQGLLGGQLLRHGVLHLVEGGCQPPHLIAAFHRKIRAGKIALGNTVGSLRQPQQRTHHCAAQHPDEQQHQHCRRQEQLQIQPRQMPEAGLCAAVKGVFLFQRGLCQPQRVFGKVVLQRHHMVHLFNIGICRR